MIKLFIISLSILLSHLARAGNSDLRIVVDHNIPESVRVGQIGDFSLTITNLGPDDAGANSGDPFPVAINSSIIPSASSGGAEIAFYQDTQSQPCFFLASIGSPLPGHLPIYRFSFYLPEIQSGDSFTCFGRYQVGEIEGSRTIDWSIRNTYDQDADLSNNQIEMSFRVAPRQVPSLSALSVLILVLLIFAVSYFTGRSHWQTTGKSAERSQSDL